MAVTENGPAKQLGALLSARYTVIAIASPEEQRVESAVLAVAQAQSRACIGWSCARGFAPTSGAEDPDGTTDPLAALDRIRTARGRAVYILKDFHAFLTDTQVKRAVRDLAIELRSVPAADERTVIVLAPSLTVPEDLRTDVAVIDWPLPDRRVIGELLAGVVEAVGRPEAEIAPDRAAVVEAATGLTCVEIENAFALALANKGRIEATDVLEAKRQAVRKSGVLEFYPATANMDDVAGLDVLKGWIRSRRRAFSPEARAAGVDAPKGALLVGPPGTGKSLSAKVIASALGFPLIRLDVGRLLGSLVGESEGNLRAALKVIESVAPCVVWIDEVEKALAGAGTDTSGVTTRLVGSLLTWTVEKTAPVYVVATANDVTSLPPELTRKGRFDETWILDLPQTSERAAILDLHLDRRGQSGRVDTAAAARASTGFSGAELEAAIVDALTRAFEAGRPVVEADLLAAIGDTAPLSVTYREQIDSLRAWAKGRARFASSPEVERVERGSRFAAVKGEV